MRIGIDATALPARLFGAGNYIVSLIQALPKVGARHEFVVFAKPEHASLFDGQGLRLVPIHLPIRIQRIAWEQLRLPSLARQYELDVLHSPHYTMPLLAPCPTVVTFHDMTFFLYPEMHMLYKRVFFRAMIRLSARHSNALVAISQSTRADVLRLLGGVAEKVFAVPYGISEFFYPVTDPPMLQKCRQEHQLPDRFILYVGNFEPRKNLPILLTAFAQLVHRGLPHHLVLAGSRGWKDSRIFATVQGLGLTERVHFPGYVPQTELPALYSLCDAFVYPSVYEGFGLPVLEAMACGVPVVTSNVSSMPEVIGSAGILVNPHDADALADALWRVSTNTELRDTLAHAGRERSKSFSWERAAKETLAVYEHVRRAR